MLCSTPRSGPVVGCRLGGKYRVLREIGEGGVGRVFAAENEALGQIVAVKVAKSSGADERLWREALAAARLCNLHSVRVFDVGRLEDGSPYVVMELLEGESLRSRLDRVGTIPVAQALLWTRQLTAALREAHAANLVHRDIKPSNIFLVGAPGDPVIVKLVDFGLVKDVDVSGDTTHTGSGVLLGSPWYMSPEQVRATDVSFASDIWSLGVVLYEMLSGTRPFRGETVSAVLAAIAADPPTPLHEVAGGLAPEVEALVSRCLRKLPRERFGSAAELAQALDSVASLSRHPPAPGLGELPGEATASGQSLVAPFAPRRSNPAWRSYLGRGPLRIAFKRRWLVASVVLSVLLGVGFGVTFRPKGSRPAVPSAAAQDAVVPAGAPQAPTAAAPTQLHALTARFNAESTTSAIPAQAASARARHTGASSFVSPSPAVAPSGGAKTSAPPGAHASNSADSRAPGGDGPSSGASTPALFEEPDF
jgi:eukaryotic-like serine/threonine-protein kinase